MQRLKLSEDWPGVQGELRQRNPLPLRRADRVTPVCQKGDTPDSTQWCTRKFTYNSLTQLLSTCPQNNLNQPGPSLGSFLSFAQS